VEAVVNAAIEMHDSQVVAVQSTAGAVIVRLVAYVHRSDGRPGSDAGTGWSQLVDLVFAGGVIEEQPIKLPCTLDDGCVSGDATFAGLVPIPASVKVAVRLVARGLSGEVLAIRGEGLDVVPVSEGQFVELFPGDKSAEQSLAAESR
jgi:hypothetical protein